MNILIMIQANNGFLLQSIFNGHVFSFSCRGYHMFTLANRWIFFIDVLT
jgi:hypothetical protein